MKKAWIFLADRFDVLKPRERVVVFLALAALLVGLFFVLVFNPAYARYTLARSSLQQSEQGMQALQAQALALLDASNLDPDAETRRQLAQVAAENASSRQSLASAQVQLAGPDKMSAMLRDLIAAQEGITLLAMHTLPAEDLLTHATEPGKPQPVRAPDAPGLYRHGIVLSVRGDYRALAAYLRRVESLPWQLHLTQVSLQSVAYPQATMQLDLYTLSLERAWLSF